MRCSQAVPEELQKWNCMSHHLLGHASKPWRYHIIISVPSTLLHPYWKPLVNPEWTPSSVSLWKLVSALLILGEEMILSKNMNILPLSNVPTRQRNETPGLFEFLSLHSSPFSLMCTNCINKSLLCKLSKLLLWQPILKGPLKKWKVTKSFKSLGKKNLMLELHLLHLPRERQEEAQKGWKFILRRKDPEATEPRSLSEVHGWNLKADIFHFKKSFNGGND